jgi:MSHA biogenesis protein MshE
MRKKIRLGDLLVQNKVISEAQLMAALEEQKKTGRKLGKTLTDLGVIDEDRLLNFLSQQLQIPFVDLAHYSFDKEAVNILPETYARRFRAVVLKDQGADVLVGFADPIDIFAYDEVSRIIKRPIAQAVIREAALLESMDRIYRRTDQISSLAEAVQEQLGENDIDLKEMLDGEVNDAPIVRLLLSIFEDAVQVGTSDIHIEPDETVLRIRQRIDGVLQEQVMKEKRVAQAMVSRLKLMAGLDISEKRLPQDGRFNIKVKGRSIDVRMSTMPMQDGESVVMRLLDQSNRQLGLDKIGMPPAVVERFRRLINRPHGVILVTGPTGSGKTTTLYSALTELNEPESKVITVEDPVEYRMSRIVQVQVHQKIGLTFASVLRATLRQDPDVIMIGEMRDTETAQIGMRAAMTGHLVLSTLHTNDSISSAGRLLDMGVEPFLAGSALRGILAQRLIRRICSECSGDDSPDRQDILWMNSLLGRDVSHLPFKKGRGCTRCNNTGYKGRVGVYELLEIDTAMADALRANDQVAFAKHARVHPSYRSLTETALDSVEAGLTTLDEVMRISGDLEVTPSASPPEAAA